jgi:type II secretory pathway pseudopilin PulG
MSHGARTSSLIGTLIAVVTIAIVAALVAPEFSEAGVAEGRMDELCGHLQMLRSQIELYKVQHRDEPPMRAASGTITFDPQMQQLVNCTDPDGNLKLKQPTTMRSAVYAYGPYLRRVPENPFNNSSTIVRVRSRSEIPVPGGAGWAYVPETGEIYANDSAFHARL